MPDVHFDNRLDQYRGFFDHSWARDVFTRAHGTVFEEPLLSLCTEWKGASNAFRTPWLSIQMLEDFQVSFGAAQNKGTQVLRALKHFVSNSPRMGVSVTKRQQLVRVLDELDHDVQESAQATGPAVPRAEIWDQFICSAEFVLSLRSSIRLTYGALYFAFEEFLRSCMAIVRREPSYRIGRASEFSAPLNSHFWPTAAKDLWEADTVVEARLVRNALAHNGGRVTRELNARSHNIHIDVDGCIQLMAGDVRQLFEDLKERVRLTLEHLVSQPQFQSPGAPTSPH